MSEGWVYLLALLVLAWALTYDPLAHAIPDDIPGSEEPGP